MYNNRDSRVYNIKPKKHGDVNELNQRNHKTNELSELPIT